MKTHKGAVIGAITALAFSAHAKIITVNTEVNTDFTAGKTNLVKAIGLLADGDTINFNIPGSGVHYLQTPDGGYPLITNNSVTIDGYSQPGAVANSNPIHAANNAQLKICLASTNGNALSMGASIAAATGFSYSNLGFGTTEMAILGFFRGSNAVVKGLAILSAPQGSDGVNTGDLKSISFCPDSVQHAGNTLNNCRNWRVSGCWFGVQPENGQVAYMPDGVTVATPTICIAAYRTRDNSGANVQYPQPATIGVAAGSANAHAEHNVFVTGYGFDSEGLNFRIAGNFWGVLPDGLSSADISLLDPAHLGDGFIEIGRDGSNCTIGTDGDGVNDADEGNVFGGIATGSAVYLDFYSSTDNNIVIAGNWFNLGVDGVTRFTNSAPLVESFPSSATVRFGSDFDGVSDSLEANRVYNITNASDRFFAGSSGSLNPGIRLSFRGNVTVNNELVPFSYANGFNTRLANFTNYESFYMDTNSPIIPTFDPDLVFPHLTGTFAAGTNGYTNIIIDVYQLDPESWANGKNLGYAETIDPNTGAINGWPQGKKYVASYTVPNTGSFDVNLTGLDLGLGPATVTINYSADPAGTHNGRVHTSNFSNPGYFIPGFADSVGLTHVAADVACWYDNVGGPGGNGYVTNGFINLAQQPALVQLGNWEPYASVLGDSTFLVGFGTYANDGIYANQNFCVAKQPAAGGVATVGYEFYDDSGAPFMGVINLSRQNGNPQRVAGDPRYGAVKFITEAECSIAALAPFQTVSRWSSNNVYSSTPTNRYAAEQLFSLNPLTLVQTPVTNAWDYVYGNYTGSMGAANNAPQCSRTGGRPNFLDNGNIVVMIDDKTAISSTAGEVTTFAIIGPTGSIVKSATLAKDNQDIWDNMCAFKGGFCIRVHNSLLFYDNAGTLQHSNDVNASSGLLFGNSLADAGGRGDSIRIGSDIRSYYVYLAGQNGPSPRPIWVAVWDSRTGNYIASAQVTDGDPATFVTARTMIAVDALDRFCVVYDYQPTTAFKVQTAARVMAFDGANITYLTHSFFPFVNAENNPSFIQGFTMFDPSVAMTPRQICIASKGTINSTDNPASGPDSQPQQTVYTVVSHPAPVAAPRPNMVVTRSGANAIISWQQDAGLFVLQSAGSLSSPIVWNDVSPQPATVGPANGAYSMTVTIGTTNKFFRLIRRW